MIRWNLVVALALVAGCSPAPVTQDTDIDTDVPVAEDSGDPNEVQWIDLKLSTADTLYAVWTGPSVTWAFGANGAGWKIAGQAQTPLETGSGEATYAGAFGRMDGDSPEITLVGDSGLITEFVDGEFSSIDLGTANFLDVDGTDAGERLTAVGWGGLYRKSGDSWNFVDLPGLARLSAVRIGEAIDFAVGDDGVVLSSFGGGEWVALDAGTTVDLHAIDGAAENDVWVVGDKGTILHYDGTTWTPVESGVEIALWGVWVAPNGDVFVVGNNGYALRGGVDGFSLLPTGVDANLYAVYGRSATDVWAVGNRGQVIRYTGR